MEDRRLSYINEEPFKGYNLPEDNEVDKINDDKISEDTYNKYLGVEVVLPGLGIHPKISQHFKLFQFYHFHL